MPQNMMVPRRRALVAPLSLVTVLALGGGVAEPRTPKITGVKPLKLEIGQRLTVTGKNFVPGANKNILVFKRDGKPAVFVKVTEGATSTKLAVVVPPKLMPFLTENDKAGIYRFRLRVLGKRFGDAFTATKLSPQIGAPGSVPGPGVPGAPAGDCDNDKSPNDVDTDDDNDKLSDAAEADAQDRSLQARHGRRWRLRRVRGRVRARPEHPRAAVPGQEALPERARRQRCHDRLRRRRPAADRGVHALAVHEQRQPADDLLGRRPGHQPRR